MSEGADTGKHKLLAGTVPFLGALSSGELEHVGGLEVPGRHQVATQADLLCLGKRKAVALGCSYVTNSLQAENHGWGEPVI